MSIEKVKEYFRPYGMEAKIIELESSSATVELAAQALDVIPARIAKTLSFSEGEGCLLLVTAGDAKIDNKSYKARFGAKPRMLDPQTVASLVGHKVGGVCPFAIPKDIPVYLDESLRRFETVFPACGSGNSAIELTCEELSQYSGAQDWVDVCKGWRAE
ncbi:YbaK/EbsC family protein [Oscillospiraceae bacterium MB08-C2-2]|nr:YbaK/EbsC family protein [Oscillospiraceae bacterium MB08-C2-2]